MLALAAASVLVAAQPNPPSDLAATMAKARPDGRLVSWCRGQFRPGGPHAYAAAVASVAGGGSYIVTDHDASVTVLAAFKGAPDLSCYTPAEARKLNESIRTSETISGRVAPAFSTTVVCGFVEETNAVCWQYSPASRAFIKIGEWQT